MASDLVASLLAGGFAIVGGFGGIVLTGRFTQRAEQRHLVADDERRWLSDRRRIYASYLALATSMLKQVDSVGIFLAYDGTTKLSAEDQAMISDGLLEYFQRWDDELEPALVEVQLISTPKIADLAERATDALMEITGPIEARYSFTEYYPGWFQARDILEVLKNAMRSELGVSEALANPFPRPHDWPWLPDRPPRQSYIQNHPDTRNQPRPRGAGSEASRPDRPTLNPDD
jgi:hypothetical protein